MQERLFVKREPITRGWSGDRKFCVTTENGEKFLLRISPPERLAHRKALHSLMEQAAALGVPMCRPVDLWVNEEGVCSLQSWVEGEDADRLLPLLPETEQYVLGLESGKILRKLHSLPAPEQQENWEVRFTRKTQTKIEKYRACGERFAGDEAVISYLESHWDSLKDRPQCFQHGDYHVGNMMLENGMPVVIDFDRYDFGDPWEEFNRIVWSAEVSPYFATGQLRGYFGGDSTHEAEPPMEFWRLLAFYIGSNTLSSIYWAIDFGPEQLALMKRQAAEVLSWYDGMKNPVPTWYLRDFYIQYTDGVPYKLAKPYDFSFLRHYGRVFRVFDDQDSGNICFGIAQEDGKRLFVKFAGAPTARSCVSAEQAMENLKRTEPVYRDLRHPSLIRLVEAVEIGGGYAMVFDWVDSACMGRMYPLSRQKFMSLPLSEKEQVYADILRFHAFVAQQGYVAIDFYDGSVLYDFTEKKAVLCDIDFYAKMPYTNEMGRLWGSSRFMSPEEYELGAAIDEVTNVYAMGAMAFALFSGESRERADWPLSAKAYEAVSRAVSPEREKRQQSLSALVQEWGIG